MKLKKNEQLKYNIYLAIKEYSKEHCMYPTSKELYTTLVSLPYDIKNTPKRVKDVFRNYIDAIVIWYTIDFIKQVDCNNFSTAVRAMFKIVTNINIFSSALFALIFSN